ncbi:MAG: hypothetical protein HY834_04940 [Devosia nanyangense]|uniref:Glycosyl hydrolase family 32 N-terminal domain-containing protein n=1 Tax=Devosia nanyangense TaxID=1228055 RepID=A0A933KZA0_9HYPH|nr:hypothetical protein [Devosia nanyangense]
MQWRKLGLIHDAGPLHEKLATHAANPLAVPVGGDQFRIFFSGRDTQNRSSVGYLDFDMAQREVIGVCREPAFTFGPEGSFYSHGVSVGCVQLLGDRRYILFMGWQVPKDGHWRGDIGRLVLGDDLSLTLDSQTPLLTDPEDPISLSYPWVTRLPDGSWRMWYGSTISWDACNGEMLHVIKGAHSTDGESWERSGLSVPYEIGVAQAFSRPTLAADAEGYGMWFSYRGAPGKTYRIGYASSLDAEHWTLQLDRAGIDVSPDGWDSEMIEYPFVFDHRGERYMLYNGNRYGETGFGLAILERL